MYLIEAGEEIMNRENKEIADILRKEVKQLQSDRLIKLESERAGAEADGRKAEDPGSNKPACFRRAPYQVRGQGNIYCAYC